LTQPRGVEQSKSPTFYEQLCCQFFPLNIQAQTLIVFLQKNTKPNWCQFNQYFSYESALRCFSPITVWLCNFLSIEYWKETAGKILMKLTPLGREKQFYSNLLRA